MPVDDSLPQPLLPPRASRDEIARHVPTTFGPRVDVNGVPEAEMLRLAGARLPDVNEARLLDRVLQLVPPPLLSAVTRILIVDNGMVGLLGRYRARIVCLYTPVLRLSLADPRYRRRFSLFTTTTLHEIAHGVYAERLTGAQRRRVVDLYLDQVSSSEPFGHAEPSEHSAEHYFVNLFVAGLLGFGDPPLGVSGVRHLLRDLGVTLP
jgi:hypothetical protein